MSRKSKETGIVPRCSVAEFEDKRVIEKKNDQLRANLLLTPVASTFPWPSIAMHETSFKCGLKT